MLSPNFVVEPPAEEHIETAHTLGTTQTEASKPEKSQALILPSTRDKIIADILYAKEEKRKTAEAKKRLKKLKAEAKKAEKRLEYRIDTAKTTVAYGLRLIAHKRLGIPEGLFCRYTQEERNEIAKILAQDKKRLYGMYLAYFLMLFGFVPGWILLLMLYGGPYSLTFYQALRLLHRHKVEVYPF